MNKWFYNIAYMQIITNKILNKDNLAVWLVANNM